MKKSLRRNHIKLLLKFRYAFRGIAVALKTQSSFRFHLIAAIVVYLFGFLSQLDLIQWVFINSSIIFVIVAELFNTSLERLCDFIHPKTNKMIEIIKDISAGAVLVSVLNAVITGIAILISELINRGIL